MSPSAPPPIDVPRQAAQPGAVAREIAARTLFTATLEVWSRNLLPFAAMSVLALAPPAAGIFAAAYLSSEGWWLANRLFWLVLPFAVLEAGGLAHGALQHLSGSPVRVASMLGTGTRRALQLGGVAAIVALLAVNWPLPFFLPAVAVAPLLVVAAPIVVAERVGFLRALGRWWRLTRGHRGSVFGAAAGVIVVFLATSTVASQLVPVVFAQWSVVGMAITEGVNLVAWALPLLAPAVVYEELRSVGEGAPDAGAADPG